MTLDFVFRMGELADIEEDRFWSQARVLIAIAAGFMGLIVRIVKNVFEQAITMKDELDLTV